MLVRPRRKTVLTCSSECLNVGLCHGCGWCMAKHCECGDDKIQSNEPDEELCLESRACNCLTQHRCKLCKGCRKVVGGHCRCLYHTIRLRKLKQEQMHDINRIALEAMIRVDGETLTCNKHKLFQLSSRLIDVNDCACFPPYLEREIHREEKRKNAKIRRSYHIPSTQSLYDQKISNKTDSKRDLLFNVYNLINKGTTTRSEGDVNQIGPYGSRGTTYMESIEDEVKEPKKKQDSIPMASAFYRAMDLRSLEVEINAQLPKEDLIDFIVYIASIKITNMPEMIGSFETSAGVALGTVYRCKLLGIIIFLIGGMILGIIVEEYIRQLVLDFVERGEVLEVKHSADVVRVVHDFLNSVGVSPSMITIEEIEKYLEQLSGGKNHISTKLLESILENRKKLEGQFSQKRFNRLKKMQASRSDHYNRNSRLPSANLPLPFRGLEVNPDNEYGRPAYSAHLVHMYAHPKWKKMYATNIATANEAFDLFSSFRNYRKARDGKLKRKTCSDNQID